MKNKMLIPSIIILSLIIYSCDNGEILLGTDLLIPELVLIDKDLTFNMGNSWDRVEILNIPVHMVNLTPYFIGKYEITNSEYYCFVRDEGYLDSTFWSKDGWRMIKQKGITKPIHWDSSPTPWKNYTYSNQSNTPICNISWWEAEAYCKWLSIKTGENYNLPTEAQWERAARGPDPGRIFPWGNVNDLSKYNVTWSGVNNDKLNPVGTYENGKSYDGCYDMTGNVMEFCSDWLDKKDSIYDNNSSYYRYCFNQGIIIDPKGPLIGQGKVVRGQKNILSSNSEKLKEISTTQRWS